MGAKRKKKNFSRLSGKFFDLGKKIKKKIEKNVADQRINFLRKKKRDIN